jgi:hypothetical protein
MMGRFVELPYTLSQDHTLMVTLAEQTPRLWLEKVEFIRRYHGLALVNSHPDYLRNPQHFAIYEAFLKSLSKQKGYWHALPRDAARWWRTRAAVKVSKSKIEGAHLPDEEFEFTMGYIRLDDTGGITI